MDSVIRNLIEQFPNDEDRLIATRAFQNSDIQRHLLDLLTERVEKVRRSIAREAERAAFTEIVQDVEIEEPVEEVSPLGDNSETAEVLIEAPQSSGRPPGGREFVAVRVANPIRDRILMLVGVTFRLYDGGDDIAWERATTPQHRQRRERLRANVRGLEETIAKHDWAIEVIEEHGVECLADLLGDEQAA